MAVALLFWAVAFWAVACGGDDFPGEEPGDSGADTGVEDARVGEDTAVVDDTVTADAGPDTDRADTADTVDTAEGEVCDDGVDNDENGAVDCADEACTGFPRCAFTAMSSGRSHTCGAVESGEVVCWGYNGAGQLGNGEVSKTEFGPTYVEGVETAVDVTAGLEHTCARLSEGGIRCWGANDQGQLGDDSFADSPTPVEVAGVDDTRDVSAGGDHTCAVVNDTGNVWCWGANDRYQAGAPDRGRRRTPGSIASFGTDPAGFTSVSTGIQHTCALRLADPAAAPENQLRSAHCWGANDVGQIAYRESVRDFVLAARVPATDGGMADIVPGSLAAGQNSTCVIRDGGSVWCWGDGTNGHFGSLEYTSSFQYEAVEVPTFGDAERIWHEVWHVCAERSSGRVVCWGDNVMQTFADVQKVYLNPVQLGDLQTPRDMGPGDFVNCWADAEGRGFCQGDGQNGKLGRPIAESSTSTPQRVVPPAGAQ